MTLFSLPVILKDTGQVDFCVTDTVEEWMIAKTVRQILNLNNEI
jgi:hypothetical protein